MIKEDDGEYIVEFNATIVEPSYIELLHDPQAADADDITGEITDKVQTKKDFENFLPPMKPLWMS